MNLLYRVLLRFVNKGFKQMLFWIYILSKKNLNTFWKWTLHFFHFLLGWNYMRFTWETPSWLSFYEWLLRKSKHCILSSRTLGYTIREQALKFQVCDVRAARGSVSNSQAAKIWSDQVWNSLIETKYFICSHGELRGFPYFQFLCLDGTCLSSGIPGKVVYVH